MTRVFLSYARDDDEPFVKRLYEDLTKRGVEAWWDRVSMPSRALTFLHEIRDAITERDRLILVVGPKAITSDYVRQEWQWALEIGKAVNPVLRLGDYDLLPEELKLIDAPDFRDGSGYSKSFETLLRQLSEPVPPMGKLIGVPSLPPHLLKQPDRLRAIKDAVLADIVSPVVVSGTAARTGIHGMGGIGKSVLATVLARDHQVRRAFPDGVLWVPIGKEPNLVELQRLTAKAFDNPGHFEKVGEGKAHLTRLFADKACLLILDDLWNAKHAEAFDFLGPRCRIIITSRDASLTTTLGGKEYQVQLLTKNEALAMLSQWAECPIDELPHMAHDIVAECGRLPIALAICGAMVRDGTTWNDLLDALREAELEFVKHHEKSILKSIKVSVDTLTSYEVKRFSELRVFPPDGTVPEAAVLTLWSHTGKMKDRHGRLLLITLEKRALIRLDYETPKTGEESKRRLSMHDLIYDYLTIITKGKSTLHKRLLVAYQKKCKDGWHTGPDDGYFFQHMRHHLGEVGRAEELVSLLLDLKWLEAKAEKNLIFDLLEDFIEGKRVNHANRPKQRILSLLEEAIRRDIHFISRHPTTLFQCLWNTCWWYDCPEAASYYVSDKGPWDQPGEKLFELLEKWRREKEAYSPGFLWLRTLRPLPLRLGGSQKAVLMGHEDKVTTINFSPDGQKNRDWISR